MQLRSPLFLIVSAMAACIAVALPASAMPGALLGTTGNGQGTNGFVSTPPAPVALTVEVLTPNGSVSSTPSGITCAFSGGRCATKLSPPFSLTAVPDPGDDTVAPPVAFKPVWAGPNGAAPPCVATGNVCAFFSAPASAVAVTVSFVIDPDWNNFPGCSLQDRWCTDTCSLEDIDGPVDTYRSLGYSSGATGYCEAQVRSNLLSIGGGKLHSYEFSGRAGQPRPSSALVMQPDRVCIWRSSTAVLPADSVVSGKVQVTASNSISETRHWSYGARFATAALSDGLDALDWNEWSGPYCADETGCVFSDPCPPAVTSNTLASLVERRPAMAPSAGDAERSESAVQTRGAAETVIDREVGKSGSYAMTCPSGSSILHADAAVIDARRRSVSEPYVDHGDHRARFTVRALAPGAHVALQLVCRRSAAPLSMSAEGHVRGSTGNDAIRSSGPDQHIHTGAGDDVVRARHRGAQVFTGSGDDRIVVTGRNSGVAAGPGRDRIESRISGSAVIEGGSGPDTLVSYRTTTLINAEDGRGDDVIICAGGSHSTVVKDPGDTVRGACRVVRGRAIRVTG